MENGSPGKEGSTLIGSSELCSRTGATHRQIDYWTRQGIITPVGEPNPGSGVRRRYHEEIVERVKTVVKVSQALGGIAGDSLFDKVYMKYQDGYIEFENGVFLVWDFKEEALPGPGWYFCK